VHAVLKRARSALPSTSVIGLEVSIPPVQPNVATPQTGLPTVDEGPRERAPSQPPGRGSQPSLRPSTPALSANSAGGLRPAASTHGGTKLGVAPPGERPSKPHPVASRAMTGQPSRG